MLILSRKAGEQIVVNRGEVFIEVLEVQGNRVKLGITAGPEVSIVRGENYTPGEDSDDPTQRTAG